LNSLSQEQSPKQRNAITPDEKLVRNIEQLAVVISEYLSHKFVPEKAENFVDNTNVAGNHDRSTARAIHSTNEDAIRTSANRP
jgi:hypothetical protein